MDGPYNGPPPGTWDIHQSKPPPFEVATFYHVVPHTEEVRNRDLPTKSSPVLGQSRNPWLDGVMIAVVGVGIDVSIAMDLVESVKGMHKEIIKQKIVFTVTEMATEDVTFVMVQELGL